jgi:neurotransmitter:Na+ symporter, NSS family
VTVATRGELGGWQSRTTFVLALSASAVGLGNLWRFSYLVGEHGGGAFVLTYVLCLFLVAVPVMVAEVVLGSHGRGSPLAAIRRASDRSLLSRGWMLVGVLACLTGILILSYYTVVAGWALAYAYDMQAGTFSAASAAAVGEHFAGFLVDPLRLVFSQSLFLLAVMLLVALGVRLGLGLLVWLVVPALVTLLAILIKFGFDNGDIPAARDFLFSVKLVDFSPQAALVALGQAFYTLSVGVGTGISYGAYAPRRTPIGRSVIAVAVFDTVIALLAGLAVFPVIFANNLEPSMGPGLVFFSVPYAFGNIAQGDLFGALFFLLVVLAALGSAVAIMEPAVGGLIEMTRFRRPVAVLFVGGVIWTLGLAVALSLADGGQGDWYGRGSLLSLLDRLTADCLLPLVALLTALLVGWRMRRELLRAALRRESAVFFSLWRLLLRYIAPAAMVLILLAGHLGGPG